MFKTLYICAIFHVAIIFIYCYLKTKNVATYLKFTERVRDYQERPVKAGLRNELPAIGGNLGGLRGINPPKKTLSSPLLF